VFYNNSDGTKNKNEDENKKGNNSGSVSVSDEMKRIRLILQKVNVLSAI
jgi:hypothetical protein